MAVFANILPTAQVDGLPYATSATLASSEADIGTPAAVRYGEAVLAMISLVIAGGPSGNTAYVVMQTDLGNSDWIDVAWCATTSTSNGTLKFILSAGVAGANAVAQTRASGTAPGSSGSNQIPIGGRIRFVGQATLTGGTAPTVKATVRYKLLGLR